MAIVALDQHIEMTPGTCGGRPRIAGRRIRVQDVVAWHLKQGQTIEWIVSEFGLTLSEVYAALAFYYDNREEIDRQMTEDAIYVAELRAKTPSVLQAKLKAANAN